jgi:ABC-type branched-subunit amino acid transport system ATPase component
MNALVVSGVTKTFAGLTALDSVSLTLAPGEILGVMGPNGSGKTTLVNVISGILAPDAGSVTLDGRDISGKAPLQVARAGISRSFQTVRLFKGLSVRENVQAVIRHPRRPVDRVVDELLDRLRIGALAETPAGELAYGLQRRVEIARALATEPRYLLLDEPAAGLNDAESQDLEAIIREVAKDPSSARGVLIIDHDIRMITGLCDRLHVLASGRTIAEGDPGIVRTNREVVRAYLGDRRVEDVAREADGG